MIEANGLGTAVTFVGLKKGIVDSDRITDRWPELSQSIFSGDHTVSKVIISSPTNIYNYIAVHLLGVGCSES